jgi:hypothetical protein
MKNSIFLALLFPTLLFGQGAFKKGTKGNDYIIVTNYIMITINLFKGLLVCFYKVI